ncbi:MAG TPA: PfaD family polyunsaturated fatty acid/polyketide biosynthesis protein [Anaerolineaceae bacterium]|nr:PfaD family polyunsaturated fatty acid/polyketide biosynthesis protein [Anaerolineaceae bacterium]
MTNAAFATTIKHPGLFQGMTWQGPVESIAFDEAGMQACLSQLDLPCYVVRQGVQTGMTTTGSLVPVQSADAGGLEMIAAANAMPTDQFGDPDFMRMYGVQYAYMVGSMANGISSADLVVAIGKAGCLGSFGSAGLSPARIEEAIQKIQAALPNGPYAFNVIHNPNEPNLERKAVELFLQNGVHVVEASAFLSLTPNIVQYRAAGLSVSPAGEIQIGNRILAKVSRKEVATKFMEPAPQKILAQLVEEGRITQQQAILAEKVPVADDITVEADSGGHTDNRPLVALIPSMIGLRDEIQQKFHFLQPVRIGAAGGIATPESTLAAFMMGAAYVLTGSINQGCVEAGSSAHTKSILAQAAMTDVTMAPSADMFEMGVKVQVLKARTLFPMRASKLFELYNRYDSLEAIPVEEREKLEKQIFQRTCETVWEDTVKFFKERDPEQIVRANANPKRKMALVFRWYLGLSSRWSNSGEPGREMDYQIWCGPSMGAFNDWTKGTYLEDVNNRRVADIAFQLLNGAAYHYRVQSLQTQGVQIPLGIARYRPTAPLI